MKKLKIIIDKEGHEYLWDPEKDFSTKFGVLKASKNPKGPVIKTHLKHDFTIMDATFVDKLSHLKRGPATPSLKDIGIIIARTGLSSSSKVVDAGTGSGFLAAYLANITPCVTSYDLNKNHFQHAKKNLEKLNVSIKLKNKDISKGIPEKNLDLITLDLPEPWKVLRHAAKSLKSGGFLVCFLPQITQVQHTIEASKKYPFHVNWIGESIEREWRIEGRICRPRHHALVHTGFLVILRKI